MGATIGQDLPVEFETNSISLQLPSNRVILEDGWIITPLFNPEVRDVLAVPFLVMLNMFLVLQITKEAVDNFKTGRILPSCQLTAVWTKESTPSVVIHQMILRGAKTSSSYISIVLNCDSIPLGS